MEESVSYMGIEEAVLIHALYHGTSPLGLGVLQDKPDLDVQQVREDLARGLGRGELRLYIDYYRGRPLKTRIDVKAKTFTSALYDRDAGAGAARRVVDKLLVAAPAVTAAAARG